MEPEDVLARHLETWLGAWPPPAGELLVVGSEERERPGWDGKVRAVAGVAKADGGAVLSVPTGLVAEVQALGDDLDSVGGRLGVVLGRPGGRLGRGVFRWSGTPPSPAELPDAGDWVATDDPRVPEWLQPFNGDVLIAWDDEGRYGAGVGRKQHNRYGHELAVVTEPALQRRGLARRLVAQAARRVVSDGAVATYLHDPANTASAHVAEGSGFPDIGWSVLGFWTAS
jgi:GNAT superfamily N-acetyltransferase